VSCIDFRLDHGIARKSVSPSLKLLDHLGLIEIEPGPRLVNVFRLSRRWCLLSTSLLYIRASAVREQGPAPSPVPRLKGSSRSDGRCLVTGQHATAHNLKQGLPLGLGMGSSRKAPCQAD
jgi:hypothetical protein